MIKPTLLIIISFLFTISGYAQAIIDPRHFELPDSVNTVNTIAELESFLTSSDIGCRVHGIIRLGQMGTPSDIPRLLEFYIREPYREKMGVHGPGPGIKYLSLLAIGNIGGYEAEDALLDFVDSFQSTRNSDSLITLSAICIALGRIGTFTTSEKLNQLYLNKTLKSSTRSLALAGVYMYTLKETRYSSAADSVDFLFEIIANHFSWSDPDTENHVINDAVIQTLYEINNPAVRASLGNKIAELSDNQDLKTRLERTLGTMGRAINKR